MKRLLIAAGGLVIVIVAGFFLYRHFVINSIMDGPFMENITPEVRATEPEQKPGTPSTRPRYGSPSGVPGRTPA